MLCWLQFKISGLRDNFFLSFNKTAVTASLYLRHPDFYFTQKNLNVMFALTITIIHPKTSSMN